MEENFMECDSCKSKSGTPTLCNGCLHNREVITNLKKRYEFIIKIINVYLEDFK